MQDDGSRRNPFDQPGVVLGLSIAARRSVASLAHARKNSRWPTDPDEVRWPKTKGGTHVDPAMAEAPDGAALDALERNLWRMWSRFGRGDGCGLHEHDDALYFDTPIPTLP